MRPEVETDKSEEEKNEERLLEKLVGRLSFVQTREEQERIVGEAIREVYGKLSEEKRNALIRNVLSFGELDDLMRDEEIEDIMINGLKSIYTFSTKEGMVKVDRKFKTLEQLNLFVKRLLVLSGKSKLNYINNFHLPGGSRANVIASPFGPQITIRKFKKRPLSLIDLIENNTLSVELAAQFWLYADGLRIKPANILIAGMPGSGKTTMLNALFSFFPANERIVVIEDTLELNTEANENTARLETTEELTMQDLVKNSLRMHPNRIIVGEVRGNEANDLMTAMNIGKICMGTLHANSAREAVMRLENVPMNVPTEIIPLIDVFIVMRHYWVNGRLRRVVGQVTETGGIEKKVLLSDLCSFDPHTGTMVNVHPSVIYRDRLAAAAGISPKEVMDELAVRVKVLRALVKAGIREIKQLSEFTQAYYENPRNAMAKIGLQQ
ncbi:MAG: ATPase, T2SS/T4P/T4SS family [Candidatus Micrarchaeia archaeon]